MNKNAIKKYAVWARRDLISRVCQRAALYGITKDGWGDVDAISVEGRVLSETERTQRKALIEQIKAKRYDQVMEEVAYTWFNRFSALRFMEVNGYLPSHVRVFSDEENAFKPQIMTEAFDLRIDGVDMDKVYALKMANNSDALFKYLIVAQCNALSGILPGMFQRISDYTELLFPDNLLREGSVVEQMVTAIPQEDWQDGPDSRRGGSVSSDSCISILGWLYQYYNSEKKDAVFTALQKNVKVTKENIPAATQLFTPDWIVRYMVENSLGRLWLEGHPNDELKAQWKYYLEEAEQEPQVEEQLAKIRKEYAALTPEQIKCIDPCAGSGHICAYMFDVLMQIYESYGYTTREAVASIVENNIYGLDIDDRAAQLAYFAVMMKARQYDSRFLTRGIQPHVYVICESNDFDLNVLEYFYNGNSKLQSEMETLLNELRDAKEYGSILNITRVDFDALYARIDEIREDDSVYREKALNYLLPLIQCADVMSQKYHVVVTNPPYMGISGVSGILSDFVKKNYPDSKNDLFAVFIEKCGQMIVKNGFQAMVTQHAWMFLTSYENLRKKLQSINLVNMAHLGARAFEEIGGEVVQTTSFVINNRYVANYKGGYARLTEPTTQQGKEDMFLSGENRYLAQQDNFSKIPGSPVAYWVSKAQIAAFDNPSLSTFALPRQGMATSDNNRFLRLWTEVSIENTCFDADDENDALASGVKWFPYNKGGGFRKWYGNIEYLVNWENNGFEIKNSYDEHGKLRSRPQNLQYFFRECLTWSKISSGIFSMRYVPNGVLFDVAGCSLFPNGNYMSILAIMNSCVQRNFLAILSPTLNYEVGQIASRFQ